jgi:hypothetical protein
VPSNVGFVACRIEEIQEGKRMIRVLETVLEIEKSIAYIY